MNEMEHFGLRTDSSYEFGIQDGIHAYLACIPCRRLENISTNFLQFHFMNIDDFNFLLELSK